MESFYKHSGRFSISALIYLILIVSLILPIISYLYALAIWSVGFILVKFLITVVFGFLIAGLSYIVIRVGKVRNTFLSYLFVLIIVTLGLYLHWASWVQLFANENGIELVFNVTEIDVFYPLFNYFGPAFYPLELFKSIESIVVNGIWKYQFEIISGSSYAAFLVAETVIIYLIPIYYISTEMNEPFCEVSNSWMDIKKNPPFKLVENHNEIISDILKGNFNFLSELKVCEVSKAAKNSYSALTIYKSDYNYYLKLENNIAYLDFSDKVDYKNQTVINNILIPKKMMNDFEFAYSRLRKDILTS